MELNGVHMNITLVAPPSAYGRAFSSGCFPARSIWQIATALRRHFGETVSLTLLDGDLIGQENLERHLLTHPPPDLLCVSTHTTLAYGNCLRVLRWAKEKQIPLLVGGIHARNVGGLIARNHSVDVVTTSGEKPIVEYVQYLRGIRDRSTIPGLVWVNRDGELQQNSSIADNPHGAVDLQLVDIAPYARNFNSTFGYSGVPYTFFTHYGCVWRKKLGCTFCTIPDSVEFRSPQSVWDEIRAVHKHYGALVHCKDWGDCFSGDMNWVQRLLAARPADLIPDEHFRLEVYLKPGEITTPEQARLLHDLGVRVAFVGYESGSNAILKAMQKGSTLSLHRCITELLVDVGIDIHASFVLGAADETEATLQKSLEFAQWLKRRCGARLKLCGGQPMLVLPGAPVWNQLLTTHPNYGTTDDPNVQQAQRDWLSLHCPALGETGEQALNVLHTYAEEITKLGAFSTEQHRLGWK